MIGLAHAADRHRYCPNVSNRTTSMVRPQFASIRSRQALGLVTFALLGACASVAPEPCRAGDWRTLGYRDGSQGLSPSRLLAHQDGCAEERIDPDRNAYLAGWQEGVERYCVPENGFELGSAGAAYRNVCPAGLASNFHGAYYEGHRLFLAESEIAVLEDLLAARSEALGRVTRTLTATEQRLIGAQATANERFAWLIEAKSLVREQRDLESEIDSLEIEIRSRKDELASLRLSLADAG